MMPVTTRAANINGTFGRINGDQPVAQRGAVQQARAMVGGDDEGQHLREADAQPRQILDPDRDMAARGDQPFDRLRAETRDAQQHLARGAVEVHGEIAAALQGPGGLGIERGVEHPAHAAGHHLLAGKPVEAQQPIRLVQAVFAHQRWCHRR